MNTEVKSLLLGPWVSQPHFKRFGVSFVFRLGMHVVASRRRSDVRSSVVPVILLYPSSIYAIVSVYLERWDRTRHKKRRTGLKILNKLTSFDVVEDPEG